MSTEVAPDTRTQQALDHLAKGWRILPLWGTWPDGRCRCRDGADCHQKPGKHPRTPDDFKGDSKDGKPHGFKDATDAPGAVRTFMANGGGVHNYGLVWPEGDEIVFILDVDGEGWQDRLRALIREHGLVLNTKQTATPHGGRHLFFGWPPEAGPPPSGDLFGFTTRWPWKGYVVGPGSVIGTTVYEDNGQPIADLPLSLARAALASTQSHRASTNVGDDEKVPEGHRHDFFRDRAYALRKQGLTEEEIRAALKAMNLRKSEKPLTDEELERAIGGVGRFASDRVAGQAGTPFRVVELSTVTPEPVEWCWQRWLAVGAINLLDGLPGQAKSAIAADVAGRFTDDEAEWPDGSFIDDEMRGRVLYISDEDSVEQVLVPRLMAAGADLRRIGWLTSVGAGRVFTLPGDIDHLRDLLAQAEAGDDPYRLVVLDPLASHIGDRDMNSTTDMREALDPLAVLAKRHRFAVLVVRHWNKNLGHEALSRGGGSMAGITGAARVVWAAVTDKADESERRHALGEVKNNWSVMPRPLAYHVESRFPAEFDRDGDGTAGIVWEGESSLTVDQIMHINSASDETTARTVLEELLAQNGGAVLSKTVEREMSGYGIRGKATLNRARQAIGARAKQAPKGPEAGWWTIAKGIVMPWEVSAGAPVQDAAWAAPTDSGSGGEPDSGSGGSDSGSGGEGAEPDPPMPISRSDGVRFRGEPDQEEPSGGSQVPGGMPRNLTPPEPPSDLRFRGEPDPLRMPPQTSQVPGGNLTQVPGGNLTSPYLDRDERYWWSHRCADGDELHAAYPLPEDQRHGVARLGCQQCDARAWLADAP